MEPLIFEMGSRFVWGCDCAGCPLGGTADTAEDALATLNDHRADHRFAPLTLEEAYRG